MPSSSTRRRRLRAPELAAVAAVDREALAAEDGGQAPGRCDGVYVGIVVGLDDDGPAGVEEGREGREAISHWASRPTA